MTTTSTAKPAPDRFFRLPQVMEVTGLSRTLVYQAPDFPRPYRLTTRAVAWRESEILAWMASRPRASEPRAA